MKRQIQPFDSRNASPSYKESEVEKPVKEETRMGTQFDHTRLPIKYLVTNKDTPNRRQRRKTLSQTGGFKDRNLRQRLELIEKGKKIELEKKRGKVNAS